VIVFTDGRHNTGQDPLSAARLLGSARVPVFPVLLGSERRPRDLSIGDLDYPPTVFKDDHPLLKVTVNTSGFEDQPIEIVLEKEGDDSARQTREIIANGQPMTIEFELNAAEVGRHQYTVRTDVQPDETRDDNNEKSFAMSVVDDTAHVLLLEGEPRWEFRFINNALKRDERVDVRCVLFDQPFIGLLPNPFFPQRLRLPVDADAMDESPFADMDLVIVGDVSPRQMDRRAWQLLEKFVAEGGGTLVLVAGKYSFPRRYRWEVVERLLPLTGWRPVSVQNASARTPPAVRGFRLKLTPEGEREVFLQFSALEEENRTIWANLPGHTWGLLGQAKPSATVLAYAERPQAAADPLGDDNGEQWDSLQQERQNAVIVHQHYGFGQVVWIGIDSTWRWRYRVGDKYHHRFWGQLARWAAETKAAAGNAFVKFGPVRSDVAVDEAITIRARWAQQFLRRNPDLKARAEIFREKPEGGKQRVAVLELKPHETQPLVYEGRLRSLPAGAYEVQLVVDDAKVGAEPIVAPLYVHERLTPELTDVSCNRPLLAQIADLTGGRLILPDQVHQIPKLLRPDVGPEVLHPEIPVWDHWALLLVFFTLLTAEWIVRKLNGLP
ncbi:MAG: VWA domain-containing protein, partial [Planctomycetes bacterium]|nr:VWA domain-containing protein [Planctomycetota bacterium]